MALNLKTFTDFVRLIVGKFSAELQEIDPTIQASLARGVTVASAAEGAALQEGIKDAVDQAFIQTSDGEFLEAHAAEDGVERFDPQPATGFCSVEGVLATAVPVDTELTANGNTYRTLQASSVQQYTDGVTLDFSGGIVTAVTDAEHSLATGLEVVISGATQTEYNGTFLITVIDEVTFTYELTAGVLTTDSGQYDAEYALLNIESVETGSAQNVDSGGQLAINVVDIDTTAFAGDEGIAGGLDEEDEDAFKDRALEKRATTPGVAAPPAIRASAKEIAGNTRVFVVRPEQGVGGGTPGQAGYKPQLGETVIYVLRDDDVSIIPSQSILDETKQKIIADGNWPTFLPDENLYVIAPILAAVDFTFSLITPNTTTMQNSINEQLVSFFEDNAEIEGTIPEETYLSFLRQVQDDSTGEFLTDFTLTTPTGDIVAGSGEINTRGTVTFT